MNVVCLMGRLTADVEVRQTPNGISVCQFSIAVDRYSNGERKADFITCVAWRQNAENIGRFFGKGDMIAINGSIQTRQYQDRDTGKNRTAFEVLVDRFHFAGSKSNGGNQQPAPAPVQPQAPAQTNNQPQQNWQQQAQQMGFYPQQSRFSTADLDGFAPISNDDGDLPF
ncbi:MAG: single-stranded DNA-binding protein [Oscillospiraceae bacterium]|nr:single-stranded DNA-binding protein [Oscillospiraceae bacterium]